MTDYPELSTMRAHIATAIRSGGTTLRSRINLPAPDFPIHVLDFDFYETDIAGAMVEGRSVTVEPGMWMLSTEHYDESRWDANNILSIWLFEGDELFFEHLQLGGITVGTPATHLIGYLSSGDGMRGWSFICPRQITANQEQELFTLFSENHAPHEIMEEAFMNMDASNMAHLAVWQAYKPIKVSHRLGDFLYPGFGPVIEDMLSVSTDDRHSKLLKAPPGVRQHVEMVQRERNPMLEYEQIDNQKLPIMGVVASLDENVVTDIMADPLPMCSFRPGMWVYCIEPDDTAWRRHNVLSVMLIKMKPEYWQLFPVLNSEQYLVAVVSNSSGPRPWIMHVPVDFLCKSTIPIDVEVLDETIDLAEHQTVLTAEIGLITRLGYLLRQGKPMLGWGQIEIGDDPADAGSSAWIKDLVRRRVPKGH